MPKEFEHYHCSICGEGYPSREEAGKCFWNHTELEILRWIAFELVSSCHFAEMEKNSPRRVEVSFSTKFIKRLNERFQIAELDEHGLLWSMVVKGKCV